MPENLHFNHVAPEHQTMNEVHSTVVYYILTAVFHLSVVKPKQIFENLRCSEPPPQNFFKLCKMLLSC